MKSKAFNLTMPDELVCKLDEQAKKEYSSRSDYIRKAVLNQLQADARADRFFRQSEEIGKKLGLTSEQDVYDIVASAKQSA